MDFGLVAGLIAGLVATIVMTVMMKMSQAMVMTEMPSFEIMTGSMVSGRRTTAIAAGAVIHYVVMGIVVFGLGYALLFSVFGSAQWWLGMVIGLVHGLVVGLMAMPMMPSMHPRMGRPDPLVSDDEDIHLTAPGIMGKNWGSMTPIGVLAGHAVYGIVHAITYNSVV